MVIILFLKNESSATFFLWYLTFVLSRDSHILWIEYPTIPPSTGNFLSVFSKYKQSRGLSFFSVGFLGRESLSVVLPSVYIRGACWRESSKWRGVVCVYGASVWWCVYGASVWWCVYGASVWWCEYGASEWWNVVWYECMHWVVNCGVVIWRTLDIVISKYVCSASGCIKWWTVIWLSTYVDIMLTYSESADVMWLWGW